MQFPIDEWVHFWAYWCVANRFKIFQFFKLLSSIIYIVLFQEQVQKVASSSLSSSQAELCGWDCHKASVFMAARHQIPGWVTWPGCSPPRPAWINHGWAAKQPLGRNTKPKKVFRGLHGEKHWRMLGLNGNATTRIYIIPTVVLGFSKIVDIWNSMSKVMSDMKLIFLPHIYTTHLEESQSY